MQLGNPLVTAGNQSASANRSKLFRKERCQVSFKGAENVGGNINSFHDGNFTLQNAHAQNAADRK
jgi:hypothetical protein